LDLAHRLAASLQGQSSFPPAEVPIETLVKKVRRGRPAPAEESPTIAVDPERVTMEEAAKPDRPCGPSGVATVGTE